MQNKQAALYRILLTPSVLGAVFYTLAAGMVLLLNQFNFIRHYLQLPDSANLSGIVLGWADRLMTHVFGKSHTDALVMGLFWAVIGLVVLFFLLGLARFMSELSEDLDERRSYLWPRGSSPNRLIRETVVRGASRLGALIGLLLVIAVLLPRELHGSGGSRATLVYVGWFAGLWLTLHLITILVRLIMLKPRIFG